MKKLGIRSVDLSLSLQKGLPLGSGLGSSAASAAIAAVAINEILENKLSVQDLVLASLKPLDLMQLKFLAEKELFFVLVTPEFEAPTKKIKDGNLLLNLENKHYRRNPRDMFRYFLMAI